MIRLRILVVENKRIVAEDLKAILEGFGYAVPAVAFSGEEAVKKVLTTPPDLVLGGVARCRSAAHAHARGREPTAGGRPPVSAHKADDRRTTARR